MSANVTVVTDDSFKAEVIDSDVPVLVDFWAPWCGPCRMVSPIVEQIADENVGNLKVVKVNTDENPKISTALQIMSIPTLMVVKDGEIVNAVIGARPKEALMREVQPYLS